jgi:hypothetical protein
MFDPLQIITRVCVFVSLVISIIILVKVSNNKWCDKNENYQKIKSTYACDGLGGPGDNSFPCQKWKKQQSNGTDCTWSDGSTVPAYNGTSCDTALTCCDEICDKDKNGNNIYIDGLCLDPN